MGILRNKEIQGLITIFTVLALVFITYGFSIGKETGILVMLIIFLMYLVFSVHTIQRYREIRKLSRYLSRIQAGEYSLDLRDNIEGELSILKSDIYKVTLMLSEYNEKLKKERLLLSDQMADISHQLKTPLTSMMVMVDLLRDDQMTEVKRKEFTSHIYIQLERIEWLLSSLLKMAKLDAGVVEMKMQEVSIQNLMENALAPLLIPMELKEITYSVTGENQSITCDLHWTREAIINIIKNCIEHTPKKGRIEISVENNPIYSEIIITDNGRGIKKEDLPHIFTRFYRGENSAIDSIGIGLAMTNSIIRSQKGNIWVESEYGKGSKFIIHFNKSVI